MDRKFESQETFSTQQRRRRREQRYRWGIFVLDTIFGLNGWCTDLMAAFLLSTFRHAPPAP